MSLHAGVHNLIGRDPCTPTPLHSHAQKIRNASTCVLMTSKAWKVLQTPQHYSFNRGLLRVEFWVPISVHSWSEANINNMQMSKAAAKLRGIWSSPAWSGRLQGSLVNTSLSVFMCLQVSVFPSGKQTCQLASATKQTSPKPRGLKQQALILSYNSIGYPFAFASSSAWLVCPVTDDLLGADAPGKPHSHLWWEGGWSLLCIVSHTPGGQAGLFSWRSQEVLLPKVAREGKSQCVTLFKPLPCHVCECSDGQSNSPG